MLPYLSIRLRWYVWQWCEWLFGPDESTPIIVDNPGVRREQSLSQILKIVVVQIELILHGSIRDTPVLLKPLYGLCQDFFACHRCLSPDPFNLCMVIRMSAIIT